MEERCSLEKCGVCDQEKSSGMYLYYLFICESCERKMIETSPEDPSYAYFITKLKQMNKKKQYS